MYVCPCECVCLCAQEGKARMRVGYPLPSLCLFLGGRVSPWTWGLDRLEASCFPSRWSNRCLWASWLVICVLYKWTRLFSNMWRAWTVQPLLQPPSFERNKWGWSDGLMGKVLAVKPDETHTTEEENGLLQVVLWSTHVCCTGKHTPNGQADRPNKLFWKTPNEANFWKW